MSRKKNIKQIIISAFSKRDHWDETSQLSLLLLQVLDLHDKPTLADRFEPLDLRSLRALLHDRVTHSAFESGAMRRLAGDAQFDSRQCAVADTVGLQDTGMPVLQRSVSNSGTSLEMVRKRYYFKKIDFFLRQTRSLSK
jgi:hypothetical protein